MRYLSLILSLAVCAYGFAAPCQSKTPTALKSPVSAKQFYIPKNLDDAFVELDKLMKPDEVAKLKSGTEDDLSDYHFGLGMWMRNNWGLWKGSRLSRWFNDIGIHHPDDMSGIILKSYWRHLNGKPLDIQKQVKYYQDYWAETKAVDAREKLRAQTVSLKIKSRLMGLRVDRRGQSVVRLAKFEEPWLRARHLALYGNGAFLTIRHGLGPDYSFTPYYLDLRSKRISPITSHLVERIRCAVNVGNTAYLCGLYNGAPRLAACLPSGKSSDVALPLNAEVPALGTKNGHLIAVYRHSVYERLGSEWRLLGSFDEPLPKPGLPPVVNNGVLYMRDEGQDEMDKRLWMIPITSKHEYQSIDERTGLTGRDGPRWETCLSYCVLSNGTVWASLGTEQPSLVKLEPSGRVAIATFLNSLSYRGDILATDVDDGLELAALGQSGDGKLYVAGSQGVYRIDGKVLRQILELKGSEGMLDFKAKPAWAWDWNPASLLVLSNEKFVLAGMYGGIGLFERSPSGKWSVTMLDHRIGKPLRY